jgi:hypothetical protein
MAMRKALKREPKPDPALYGGSYMCLDSPAYPSRTEVR